MQELRTCMVCGKLFHPSNSVAKLCSDECKKIRRAEQCKKWYQANCSSEREKARRRYYKTKKSGRLTLEEQCRVAGYGHNYGQFMTDRYFGRV